MGIFNGNGSNNVITGTSTDDEIYGLGGDDILIGIGGNDTLDGGTGEDTMDGGSGNDTYIVDNVKDKVVEYDDNGDDTVKSSVSYTLYSVQYVEKLILTGSADINGIGNGLDNTILGNSGDNDLSGQDGDDLLKGGGGDDWLNGGSGADDMYGGTGSDEYIVNSSLDTVTEYASQGLDKVWSSVAFTLGANVENLTLTGFSNISGHGNELNNELTGNSGNNFLWGGAGADKMQGLAGNDQYNVDHYFDVVTEQAGQGIDLVVSWIDYGLGANLENLTLHGTAVYGYGNSLDNIITGNAGSNVLYGNGGDDSISGYLGTDTMYGGEGNDTLSVNDASDKVIEYAGEGIDWVGTSGDMDYTLPDNVENLWLDVMGHFNDGTGNALNNIIEGSLSDNVLNGGLGQDSMYGGAGNDTYYVDNDGDITFEHENYGNDFVYSTVNLTLADNIETLSLQIGTAVSATGNAAHNTLFGNANDNVLDGGGLGDILSGLGGNDTFVFQAGQANGDVVYEFEGNGAGVGDLLKFVGYGPGATLNQMTATEWIVASADNSISEVFTLVGAPALDDLDYVFV